MQMANIGSLTQGYSNAELNVPASKHGDGRAFQRKC